MFFSPSQFWGETRVRRLKFAAWLSVTTPVYFNRISGNIRSKRDRNFAMKGSKVATDAREVCQGEVGDTPFFFKGLNPRREKRSGTFSGG